MSVDSRLTAVNSFITRHNSVPDNIQPQNFVVPRGLTVCIIGAGQGIGEHIAYAYAQARVANLVLAARSISDLEAVATRIKQIHPDIETLIVSCDIASAPSVKNLADTVQAKYGCLDILIANAGYAGPVTLKIEDGEPEWVQRAFDVNAIGTYHAAHYFVPLLLTAKKGIKAFFAVGSMAACIRRGVIANTGYTVSKMAQVRMVEYIHEQHNGDGLVALTIHPGAVMTNMAKGNTPEAFVPYLIDDVGLCGATCVALTARLKEFEWLSGRFIQANWDIEELLSKREAIVERDLLKFVLAVD